MDLIRGDPREYHQFIVDLTDLLTKAASVSLPPLDFATADTLPSAFVPVSPAALPTLSTPAVPEPVADALGGSSALPGVVGNGGPRMTPAQKSQYIEMLVDSAVGRSRESWDVYVDSIRGLLQPVRFSLLTDGGSARVRSVALANEALRRQTPDLLVATVDALAELEGAQAAGPLRELVDDVVSRWPRA